MSAALVRLSVLTAIVLTSTALWAQHGPYRQPTPRAQLSMRLESEDGRKLETYSAKGQSFVLGRQGERYNVRLSNRGQDRVEAVLSIDGRDAISGQVADFGRQRGYIVPAHGSVLIQGFRTSLASVASFRFTSPAQSYSSRMGTPRLVGSVQVAVFDERKPDPRPILVPEQDKLLPRDPASSRQDGALPGLGGATAPRAPNDRGEPERKGTAEARPLGRVRPTDHSGNLGTEYGETRYSQVFEVDFERAHAGRPAQWQSIRYDDEAGLEARGIVVRPPLSPLQPDPQRFTPPPPPISPWDEPLRPLPRSLDR